MLEDLPHPLSPYRRILFAGLPFIKESVFVIKISFCYSYDFKSENLISSGYKTGFTVKSLSYLKA